MRKQNGTLDMYKWRCIIPGRKNTSWEGGFYKLEIKFQDSFPRTPPSCTFNPVIYHPNVYSSGNVCLSLLGHHWRSVLSIEQVLEAIQDLLVEANPGSPANGAAADLYTRNRSEYEKRIKAQAKEFAF